jgi:hypothetical protein
LRKGESKSRKPWRRNKFRKEKSSFNKKAERVLKPLFRSKSVSKFSVSTAHLLLCILRNENDPKQQATE